MPPVTSTVPRGRHPLVPGRGRGARTRRRPKTPPDRTASWSSPPGSATRPTMRSASSGAATASAGGTSMRPPQVSGWSRARTVPVPHTWAWSHRTSSPSWTATAPLVTHQSAAGSASARTVLTSAWVPANPRVRPAWRACGLSSSASRESTPAGEPSRPLSSSGPASAMPAAVSSAPALVTVSAPAPVLVSVPGSVSVSVSVTSTDGFPPLRVTASTRAGTRGWSRWVAGTTMFHVPWSPRPASHGTTGCQAIR